MPLTVTDQAAATLKELLVSQRQEPDQVLRLVSYGEGNHGFQLDTPQEDDQVVEHEGEVVMAIEPSISEVMTGNVLDLKETPQGPTLTLYS